MSLLLKTSLIISTSILILKSGICDEDNNVANFVVKFTGAGCSDINKKYVSNMTCKVKPIRGGMGMLIYKATVIKPIKYVQLEATMFYKFGTTYRPWLFHFDIDMCNVFNNKPTSVFENMVAYIYKYQKYNATSSTCPLKNNIDTIINMNNESSNAFPKEINRLPGGEYKVVLRVYNKKQNEDIFIAFVKFIVKSKRGESTSMLEMG